MNKLAQWLNAQSKSLARKVVRVIQDAKLEGYSGIPSRLLEASVRRMLEALAQAIEGDLDPLQDVARQERDQRLEQGVRPDELEKVAQWTIETILAEVETLPQAQQASARAQLRAALAHWQAALLELLPESRPVEQPPREQPAERFSLPVSEEEAEEIIQYEMSEEERAWVAEAGRIFQEMDPNALFDQWIRRVDEHWSQIYTTLPRPEALEILRRSMEGFLATYVEEMTVERFRRLGETGKLLYHRGIDQSVMLGVTAELHLLALTYLAERWAGDPDISRKMAAVVREFEIADAALANGFLRAAQKALSEQAIRLDRLNREILTSVEISQAIARAGTLEEVFGRAVDMIRDRFGYYHVHLYEYDAEHQTLRVVAGSGEVGRRLKERGHTLSLGQGLVGQAAVTREPILVPDTAQDPRWLPNPLLPETRSELAIPVCMGEELLGVLDIQSNQVGGLDEGDLLLLSGVAGQAAAIIQNARLVEQVRTTLEDLRVINELVAELLTFERLHRAGQYLVKRVVELGVDRCVFAIRERVEGQDWLETVAAADVDQVAAEELGIGTRLPLEAVPTIREIYEQQEPVFIADVSQEKGLFPTEREIQEKAGVRAIAFYPLVTGGEVVGHLAVSYHRVHEFSEREREFYQALATQAAMVMQNIRARRTAEVWAQQLEVVTEVAERITSALDLNTLLSQVVELIKQSFGFYHVHIYLTDPETGMVRLAEGTGEAGQAMKEQGHAIPIGQGIVGHVAQSGEPMLVPDVSREPDWIPNPLLPETKAELAVPLKVGDEIVGVLDVQSDKKNGLTPDNMRLMLTLGRQVAIAIQNARVFGHIQEMVEQRTREVQIFQTLAENSLDAIYILDLNGRVIYANPAFYELFGYDAEKREVLGMQPPSFVAQKDQERGKEIASAAMKGGWAGELTLVRKDGSEFIGYLSVFPLRSPEGEPVGSATVFRDVTEEVRLRELERQQLTLVSYQLEISNLLVQATDLDSFAELVVQRLLDLQKVDRVNLLLLEEDEGEPVIRVFGAHQGEVESKRTSLADHPLAQEVMRRRGGFAFSPDEGDLLPEAEREACKAAGIQTILALPFGTGRRVEGALVLGTRLELSEEEVQQQLQQLQPTVAQLALGLQNLRLREAQQVQLKHQIEQRTRQVEASTVISQQIATAANLEEVFSQAVNLIKETFNYYHVHVYAYDEETNELVVREGTGEAGRVMREQGHRIPVGQGLVGRAAETKAPVLIPDVSREPGWLPNPLLPETQSELAVPILMRGRLLGVLDVQSERKEGLSNDDLLLLQGLAGQIAVAIENTRLLEETQALLSRTEILSRVAEGLLKATNEQSAFEVVAEALQATGIDFCTLSRVSMRRNGKAEFQTVAFWSLSGESPVPLGEPITIDDPTFAEWLRSVEGAVVLNNFAEMTDVMPPFSNLVEQGIRHIVTVLLQVREEPIGILAVARHRDVPFSDEEVEIYRAAGAQLSVALENQALLVEARRRVEEIERAYQEQELLAATVRELSSPVIQVWEDVLVLPLVGTIDSKRAARIMEDLLNGIVENQAERVIIDITGVPVVDAAVANYLLQTIKAASLLGARCMLVGISSEMAQTIVNLGVDLSGIVTQSNLRAGIQYTLREMGYRVVPVEEEGEEARGTEGA